MIAHCFWLWSMCLCAGLTVRSSSAVRRAVESRSERMKRAWMQKDMCEYSRWRFRKYIRHQRKLEVQRANWQAYSDAGSDAPQVKSLGLPTELSALQAGVFELRARLLEDDIGRPRSLASLQPTDAGMLLSTDLVEGLPAEVMYLIRGVDQFLSVLDDWTAGVVNGTKELDQLLACMGSSNTGAQAFYIGSSEEEAVDAEDTHSLVQEFACEDLVCLESDLATGHGHIILRGTYGRVQAIYNYDEMQLLMVHFPGEFQAHEVSDRDLRLIERAGPDGLRICPDPT